MTRQRRKGFTVVPMRQASAVAAPGPVVLGADVYDDVGEQEPPLPEGLVRAILHAALRQARSAAALPT